LWPRQSYEKSYRNL